MNVNLLWTILNEDFLKDYSKLGFLITLLGHEVYKDHICANIFKEFICEWISKTLFLLGLDLDFFKEHIWSCFIKGLCFDGDFVRIMFGRRFFRAYIFPGLYLIFWMWAFKDYFGICIFRKLYLDGNLTSIIFGR